MILSDLQKRVIGAIFIILLLALIIFGNSYFLFSGATFLSSIAIYELNKAFKNINYEPIYLLALLYNILMIVISFYWSAEYIIYLISFYLIILFIFTIFNEKLGINSIFINIFLAVYISLPYAYLVQIKEAQWLLFIFGISSFTDTFAYFIGVLFGKRKLYPKLSPNKTLEGSLGGILGASIFSSVFYLVLDLQVSFWILLFVTILLSILSQLGDLLASYIKRKSGIKDYGFIFIGHGGVMDRFDSILLIAPIVAFMLKLL